MISREEWKQLLAFAIAGLVLTVLGNLIFWLLF